MGAARLEATSFSYLRGSDSKCGLVSEILLRVGGLLPPPGSPSISCAAQPGGTAQRAMTATATAKAEQLVGEHRGPRSVSSDSHPRPLLMAPLPTGVQEDRQLEVVFMDQEPAPFDPPPQVRLALVSAFTDMVLPHLVWGGPSSP